MAAQILILGVGNVLFGDDAVGVEIVRRLQEIIPDDVAGDVEIVDGGTSGLYLLPLLERRRRVILVDAVDFKAAPGGFIEASGDRIPRSICTKLSEHQVNVHEILSLLELLDAMPGQLELIGIQPGQQRFAEPLSDEVRRAIPAVIERIIARVREWKEQEFDAADECAICAG
jgi:hydrogenase maturation protease